ncbi:septal ring lytic transglycosylase RlpA family protein [Geoalkalibacter sp.]|uniref:septal ring lytic transglycosylase RlpA family protein n=1 Tax=Geoalkalibacter sp. TaxID=3041440 RepID=UPI00272E67F2|nr:septal ring lytic transglycosylase RlpA family protein [Geoalkalibacter sp.]
MFKSAVAVLRPLSGLLLIALLGACAAPAPPPSRPAPSPAPPSVSPPSAPQPGVSAAPAPQPKLRGWERPYEVFGERYHPLQDHEGFVEEGVASWYGPDFHGKKTSNGEIYDMHAMTAAHRILPLGIHVKVTNLRNGREAILRLNDRGPFAKARIIDLSFAAAKELEVVGPGTAPVRVEALGYKHTDAAGRITYQAPRTWEVENYSVQVGAFTVLENAQRLAEQMRRQEGYSVIQQGYVGGQLFYRVRAGKFSSLAAADAATLRFESQGFGGSFVVAMD